MIRVEVFTMDNPEYRVVCQFEGGYGIINYAWRGYLQKKIKCKKYWFFGEEVEEWIEIDYCWWSKEPASLKVLEDYAIRFYDEKILMHQRLINNAMNLK